MFYRIISSSFSWVTTSKSKQGLMAFLGQVSTHCPQNIHLAMLNVTFLSSVAVIVPLGHTFTHKRQPIQASLSYTSLPLYRSGTGTISPALVRYWTVTGLRKSDRNASRSITANFVMFPPTTLKQITLQTPLTTLTE